MTKILLPFTVLKNYIEDTSNKIADTLYKEEIKSGKIETDKKISLDYKKSKIGAYVILDSLIKLSIILIPALFFGVFTEVVVMLATFGALRSFACGAHLKTFEVCLLLTIITFLILPIVLKVSNFNVHINNSVILIVYTMYAVIIKKFAPSETKKRPIKNKKVPKVISIFIIIIIATINLFIKSDTYRFLILFACSCEIILVLPITHKIIEVQNTYFRR